MLTDRIENQNRTRKLLLLLVLFLLTLWISWGFPPTGDDWNRIVFSKRTVDGFIALVRDHYETLNGRVMGNLLSYVLILPVTRYLAKAVSILLLTVMIAKLSRIRAPLALLLGFFFVMTTPRLIFIQVYTWTSGFFNYVPPMLIVLFVSLQIRPLFEKRPLTDGLLKAVLFFFLGVVGALFVEHVTLFSVVLAAGVLIAQAILRFKPAGFSITYLLGTLTGTAIMFASPVYRKILFAEDTYRTVPKTAADLIDVLLQNYRAFSRYLLFENPVFLLIVCTVCILALQVLTRPGVRVRLTQIFFGLLPVVILLTRTVFSDVFQFTLANMQARAFLPVAFDVSMHLLTYGLLIYTGVKTLTGPPRRQYVFTLLCIPVIIAPLLVVRPVLARNYYATYLLLVICVLLLLHRLLADKPRIRFRFSKWAVILTASLCLFYIGVYTANKIAFERRTDVIEAGMAEQLDTIVIPDYPVPFFVFGPGDSSLGHMYFYEKANDIEFVLESASEETEEILPSD